MGSVVTSVRVREESARPGWLRASAGTAAAVLAMVAVSIPALLLAWGLLVALGGHPWIERHPGGIDTHFGGSWWTVLTVVETVAVWVLCAMTMTRVFALVTGSWMGISAPLVLLLAGGYPFGFPRPFVGGWSDSAAWSLVLIGVAVAAFRHMATERRAWRPSRRLVVVAAVLTVLALATVPLAVSRAAVSDPWAGNAGTGFAARSAAPMPMSRFERRLDAHRDLAVRIDVRNGGYLPMKLLDVTAQTRGELLTAVRTGVGPMHLSAGEAGAVTVVVHARECAGGAAPRLSSVGPVRLRYSVLGLTHTAWLPPPATLPAVVCGR